MSQVSPETENTEVDRPRTLGLEGRGVIPLGVGFLVKCLWVGFEFTLVSLRGGSKERKDVDDIRNRENVPGPPVTRSHKHKFQILYLDYGPQEIETEPYL